MKVRWYKNCMRVICVLTVMVLFSAIYSLSLTAATKSPETYCGFDEHIHTAKCFQVERRMHRVIDCNAREQADLVLHEHEDICYDDYGKLVCNLVELAGHTHTQECYDADGTLICEQDELVEHTHTKECYANGEVICGLPQVIRHQHSTACLSDETESVELTELTCKVTEHTHLSECYKKSQ